MSKLSADIHTLFTTLQAALVAVDEERPYTNKLASALTAVKQTTVHKRVALLEDLLSQVFSEQELIDICECHELVSEFFNHNVYKVREWFRADNPLLGMLAPTEMIMMGRSAKLLQFIKNQLEENER